ncbi:MAG: DUF427 domain-containing protein [Gemmatimonadetes bacterium]|nr:DUF427 domain-containing protein [Gemmatimonadota bacterium]
MSRKAIWNGQVIAESDDTVMVEGNHYFPPNTIKKEFFQENTSHTVCPWKGTASYYDVVVDGQTNEGAAWYYPDPKSAAEQIKDHVAFWKGVEVEVD